MIYLFEDVWALSSKIEVVEIFKEDNDYYVRVKDCAWSWALTSKGTTKEEATKISQRIVNTINDVCV